MIKSKNKIIDYNTLLFSKWDNILNKFINCEFSLTNSFERDRYKKIQTDILEILIYIMNYFIDIKVKDTFSEPNPHLFPFGLSVFFKSQKMNTDFSLGIYKDYFYLKTFIDYPQGIKKMNDDFWFNLLKLNKLGEFYFIQNNVPLSHNFNIFLKRIKKIKSKSQLFNLILNYILLEGINDLIDLGSIEIRWSFNTSWEVLLNKGKEAFKILYKTKYQLYRACNYRLKNI